MRAIDRRSELMKSSPVNASGMDGAGHSDARHSLTDAGRHVRKTK